MSVRMDQKNSDDLSLIEIRIKLSNPYFQNTSFQRHDGKVTVAGKTYTYVYRKVENGFIVLKCIPDLEADALIARFNNESYNSKENKKEHSFKVIKAKQNIDQQTPAQSLSYAYYMDLANKPKTGFILKNWIDGFIPMACEPPESAII
jgi:hypothetical protein